jgi:hypothetical protein
VISKEGRRRGREITADKYFWMRIFTVNWIVVCLLSVQEREDYSSGAGGGVPADARDASSKNKNR